MANPTDQNAGNGDRMGFDLTFLQSPQPVYATDSYVNFKVTQRPTYVNVNLVL
ncbi:MAG: hypothetical protein AAGB28_07220 [Pseudomonadota bacterium]